MYSIDWGCCMYKNCAFYQFFSIIILLDRTIIHLRHFQIWVYCVLTSIHGTKPVSMKPWMMIFVGLEPLNVDVVMVKGCERFKNLGWFKLSLVVIKNLVLIICLSRGSTFTGLFYEIVTRFHIFNSSWHLVMPI